jgi:hypothetical protein
MDFIETAITSLLAAISKDFLHFHRYRPKSGVRIPPLSGIQSADQRMSVLRLRKRVEQAEFRTWDTNRT